MFPALDARFTHFASWLVLTEITELFAFQKKNLCHLNNLIAHVTIPSVSFRPVTFPNFRTAVAAVQTVCGWYVHEYLRKNFPVWKSNWKDAITDCDTILGRQNSILAVWSLWTANCRYLLCKRDEKSPDNKGRCLVRSRGLSKIQMQTIVFFGDLIVKWSRWYWHLRLLWLASVTHLM